MVLAERGFMQSIRPRRSFLKLASTLFPLQMMGLEANRFGLAGPQQKNESGTQSGVQSVTDQFPTQPPELIREVVTVSHFDLARVKELVDARPELARASWDWGFGDWETCLGAASHMGNRPIAEYLISKGARPSIFAAAMLGQLEVVKAFVMAQPGVQRIRGPHCISLLAHAKAGGDASRPVFEYLQSVGDADAEPTSPLSEADAAALSGTYAFGSASNQQIDVTWGHGMLSWARRGMTGRPLHHVGDHVFHPAGAPTARIRFRAEDAVMVMTIEDPDEVLVARRKPEGK
jgi:hypothetical protein